MADKTDTSFLDGIDLGGIASPRIRELVRRLLNLVEELASGNRKLREEVQRLRDELSRVKGEQGKPKVPGNKAPKQGDISSEKERRKPRQRSKSGKLGRIHIDREETVTVDAEVLPADAVPKGCEDVVVQDVKLSTDNVLFHKEKYYSPSEGKTYVAELPEGYEGEFGPGIKALTLTLYFGANMSEPKIAELYGNIGVVISSGQVSNQLIKQQGVFHAERSAIYEAGLASSPWHLLDATGTRVNGRNEYCHIVCGPLYTVYSTQPSADRLSVLDVLRDGRPRRFLVNAEALGLVEAFNLSAMRREQLRQLVSDEVLGEAQMQALLDKHLPDLGPNQRKCVLDATAVAAYHAEVEWPVVRLLVVDGAPQFGMVTEDLALCWVHEGRLYKKLMPLVPAHRDQLAGFLRRFWDYYHELLQYREQPTEADKVRLEGEFDTLFATVTGYDALDKRIAATKAKKDPLLMVLSHPEIPLHTNDAELGARARVRKRDVSLGPRTDEGVKAWDTFGTLSATASKLGVSFHHYIHDRVSGANKMPALADLVRERSAALNLGASWHPG